MLQQPMYPQPRATAKQRGAAVLYAREHGIKPAARHFAWSPRTVRAWMRRWEKDGEAGFAPKVPPQRKRRLPDQVLVLLRSTREGQQGTSETLEWLERKHGVHVCARTIQRIFRDFRENDFGGSPV